MFVIAGPFIEGCVSEMRCYSPKYLTCSELKNKMFDSQALR